MNRIFFLILVSVVGTTNMFSQVFVNNVERVGTVVLDYCVDDEGKRYNIVVNQEKSTYKDEGWQLGCVESFKKAELIYPMKMTNDCWQQVYYFVNENLKTKSLSEEEQKLCKAFHSGIYKYHNPAYINTKIVRRKKKQIEKTEFKDQRQVYEINWVADHIYTLKTLKLPLAKDKHKIGGLIKVEIIEVLNENTYLYKSYRTDLEDSNTVYGLISKVK
ncbi:hypothetical protein [Flagellimonas lutimaris]|uniref:hypothetical protein n=1 Tax=Flagellimonas lutimaris TaxID=475082 RepID=UPI003F5CE29E